MDDAMIALHQNGERINPSNGYPLRLLLPGYEERPASQRCKGCRRHLGRKLMARSARRLRGRLPLEPVAGNGLLDRRKLLGGSALFAGAMGVGVTTSLAGASAEPLTDDPWSLAPGITIPPYGQPSRFEAKVVRTLTNPNLEPRPARRARLTIFSMARSRRTACILSLRVAGYPDIDPDRHRLLIHGLVRQPAVYTLDARAACYGTLFLGGMANVCEYVSRMRS
jgi:DMSO/TMAO reductase YedYZ molybdopterin-dependent catalytic subunit